ncbi:mechanosensitive ion channel [Bacillus sp. H-16]|uniref:mechanosensitive ion channel n=1 Tax=Alteribacter salitolerans TaxID=2912333 RepID=UPI001965B915|nr:mechanosensitive ion channel [Alteribacter salitolerans]MBM7095464.1 mechanosensitive ion channel [Alteribacter salitolerans]
MNNVSNSFESALASLVQAIPNVIVALLLLLLAYIVASLVRGVIVKGFGKLGAPRGLVKSRVVTSEEQGRDVLRSIGNVFFFLIFILFLPSILDALNMQSVAQPITNMVEQFLAFLPNIFAAVVILVIGFYIARLVRNLVHNLLLSLNIDHWFNRLGHTQTRTAAPADSAAPAAPGEKPAAQNKLTLAKILSNIVFVVIMIPIVTVALETLNIQTISEPITSVLNTVLTMIPNIFVAIILVIAGYYLAKFISDLLISLLQRTGINTVYDFIGIERGDSKRFDLANIIGQVVKVLIIVFFTVEALNVLQLYVLNQIGNAVILYLPMVVSALLILGLAIAGGTLLQGVIRRYTNSPFSAALVKYIVIIFAVFMALDQLGFATTIVNIGFLLILGGLSIAFAISFGIGGRDFAKRNLDRFERKIQRDSNDPTDGPPSI